MSLYAIKREQYKNFSGLLLEACVAESSLARETYNKA